MAAMGPIMGAIGTFLAEYGAAMAAVISAGATAASIGVQVKSASDTAKYNAAIQKNQAVEVDNARVRKKSMMRMQLARQLSGQEAIMAAKNVSLDSVSSLSIFKGSEIANNLDEQAVDYNTNAQMNALNAGAGLSLSKGRASSIGGGLELGSSILTGGSAVAAKWYQNR